MARIDGNGRNNDLNGRGEDDVIRGLGGNDELDGNGGDDTLNGGSGNDELDGDTGNDSLLGAGGNDELDGGSGDDVLRGGKGDDELNGDNGDDMLFGGKGADTFKFESREGDDTIGDFKSGVDRILFDIDGLSFSDLNITNNDAGDAVITWSDPAGSSITLDGVNASALSNSDFFFDS